MSIDRDAPLAVCWAFNKDGLRCMQPAGHLGTHAHAIEWTDEECYSPTVHKLPTPPAVVPEATPISKAVTDPEPCVVCNHREGQHTPEGCVSKNSEGDHCGCYAFV